MEKSHEGREAREGTERALDELPYKYNEHEGTLSSSRILEEKDLLHNQFERRTMQQMARNNVQRILDVPKKLNDELESKNKKLDTWSKELNKCQALTERERQKLYEDKNKTIQMDCSSEDEDELDISDSLTNNYKDKPLEQLREGKYEVKGPHGSLICPFCAGKKKQDYKFKELLQHASGVAKDSANRNAKQKANHLALAIYLETDVASEGDQMQLQILPTPVTQQEKQEDLCV